MSYYYKKYEWSAFTEADLLKNGKNGCDFGKGDSFVAGSPTTTLSTYDNDSKLSGGDTWWCKTYAEDASGQDGYVNGCRVGCQMYAEQYHTLKGSDGKTYYLMEIKIEGHDSAGAGNGYFTYYGAQPPAGTTLTVTGTCSVDGSWIDYSCLGAGKTAPPNTPPTFTNVPANGVFCVNENTKLVIDLNASDKDCDTLSFSIAGGADGSKFTIDAKTGVLSFVTAPDYEKPTDSDGNNSYKVIVQVADGKGGTQVKELTVNVCDVKEEAPKCVVIEAEDMKLSCYTVKCATSASGGEYISLASSSGSASTTFKGVAGEYDLQMRYWDTSGDGNIKVYVNGCLAGTVRLNANDSAWHEITLEDLKLKKGDVITLKGDSSNKNCEPAIIDKIKICPSEPEPVKPGALEGRVFVDANKDGIDNGEAGVSGVTVQLLNAAGAVVATIVTAADGSYRFDGLTEGNYSVVFPTEVDGKVLTDANVGSNDAIDSDANVTTGQTGSYAVTSGNVTKDVDAGIKDPGTAAIEGRIFVDANGDGIDNEEAGAAGVTVKLLDASGAVIATTTTAADGSYVFENLDAGSYSVEFPKTVNGLVLTDANVGSDDTIDSDANTATGKTGAIIVEIGETSSDNDAGLKDPATAAIKGRIFVDANDNAVDNNEAGAAGVTVKLLNAAGAVIATTTTAADGSYSFGNLKAGDYSVEFPKTVNGLVLVDANVGGDDTIDSDANPTTGRTGTISLTLGQVSSDNDAGIKDPATASIGNFVFLDADKDGVQDAGEAGVAGVTVTLYDASGAVIATTLTTAAGEYLFSGLKAGTYTVGFTEKAGYDFTTANVGNDASDSDANVTTGLTAPITLGVGQANLTVDAGLVVENVAPDAKDDVSGTCAIEAKTVDVLANDTDADGDLLTITQVDGQAIAEGGTVDVDGVLVSLVGGKLVIDGSAAYADLLIGQKAQLDISYTVTDGKGGFDTANLDMDFCGAKNTLETIKASLPTGGTLVLSRDGTFGGDFYGVTISGTGDDRFDGKTFDSVYCVSAYEAINPNVSVPYTFYLADAASVPTGVIKYPANLDMVNWILNQDFTSQDNGDSNGQTYTEAEIQGAIWGLTDNIVFVSSSLGTNANAQEIYNLALANGEGFVAGEGDIVGLILDPTAAAEAAGNKQPLIVGIDWDDLAQDCLCY
ncbi:SdrD B-like domain-containing protein [uncultured Paracoccus sp.]|uniref:SdrD B-like domain-containing protein n=1 Tax=uncultured Paracoccus sp. TaxID=189685 RepID=UPI0025DBE41D|nr:SdrD B-like domain-containing protein [uncultured Paracoccus sp.]